LDSREIIEALIRRGETVAAAESLTAGLVCATLADVPGASAALRGGLVVYATDLKTGLAGVDPVLLAEHGAVHPEVAAQLAEGARARCGATWGLGLTGVAGPDPQDGRPVGTVHIAVAGPDGTSAVESPRLPVHGTDERVRPLIRRMTVVHALDLLRRRLLGLEATHEWPEGLEDREERP
jgi:PncC family amidohydrolase